MVVLCQKSLDDDQYIGQTQCEQLMIFLNIETSKRLRKQMLYTTGSYEMYFYVLATTHCNTACATNKSASLGYPQVTAYSTNIVAHCCPLFA